MKKLEKIDLPLDKMVLTENQMKLISGGSGGSGSVTCGVNLPASQGGPLCNVSKEVATRLADTWQVS